MASSSTGSQALATFGQVLIQVLAVAGAMDACPSTPRPSPRTSSSTPTISGTSPENDKWTTSATSGCVAIRPIWSW